MARIILKFKDKVISEITMGKTTVTVGRDIGNDIQIENPAVSSIHARIWQDGDEIFVEDADSTNGTYFKGSKITKMALKDEDEVFIGKHTIGVFHGDEAETEDDEPLTPVTPSLDKTMIMDSGIKKKFLETGRSKKAELSVISGPAIEGSYMLTERVSSIGKSAESLIKIKGFFAPKVAALINRSDKGFTIAPVEGKNRIRVNGKEITEHEALNDKDIVEVAGITMRFLLEEINQ